MPYCLWLTFPPCFKYQYGNSKFMRSDSMIHITRLPGLLLNAFFVRGRLVGEMNH
ncbi:hypothetical protein EH228_17950 [Erwinia endophytica]|uniref:leu operon leader peptide n=1 Tax=Erwinia endophytica TaxID=1563158 RepID=UPI001265F508|nr:hypothetical protein EH228_17950 [Erwinia endophytica]